MSAFVATVRPDRAFIWTDGTIWDADCNLVGFQDKCYTVEGAPMAVTGCGPVHLAEAFALRLQRFGIAFDDLLTDGAAITGEFLDEESLRIAVSGSRAADLCIAGWSETHNQPAIVLRTTYPEADGIPFKIGTDFLAPGISEREAHRMQAAFGFPKSVLDVEPSTYGIACMEAQRRTPGNADLGFEGRFVVGGHVLETVVTAEGVTHRIIHRWEDDRIGERIGGQRSDSFVASTEL